MKLNWKLPLLLGAAGVALTAPEFAALAQEAAAPAAEAAPAAAEVVPTINDGDTAWMLISSVLVLLMTVPGLALFYGGLARAKNMLSVLTQVLGILCLVSILWVFYGYSLTFGEGNAYIGDFSKAFLKGVTPESISGTIPEYVFVLFQMTFACITPALIIGAFAERAKFISVLVFAALWVTFVYFPMAHMVWAGTGMLFLDGALDFAGGTVVHMNSGIAALVACIFFGKRIGFGKEAMPPHSLVFTMVGAALLWVGWFGFNAGSAAAANATAGLAAINTFVATGAAGIAWLLIEWIAKGKPSLLGLASGVVAGLVAITPACGTAGPLGAMLLGAVTSIVCFFFCTTIKNAFGYDDSFDVFGIHGVGGIVGAIGTAFTANVALGGVGYEPSLGAQLWVQVFSVIITLIVSGIGTSIILALINFTIGLRVAPDAEREGLDVAEHGERAYN
ncbi:ammonium transporter [Zavarzinia compransoris]|uniref:Ammonium transporter n=1 Tax=Zavarzinia compransoris TaxID=1264899 RepID=A0A317E378_9PROT|nr:ammonium transporter [Zavarzinia compransoris]PWR20630.1 ammonia channel protein [Zavarzinia compransoris]TDP44553.1 ammonium transporter [Zavarzinia compransoris]